MKPDYLVEVRDMGKPLYRGLTQANVADFYRLSANPKTNFYNWCQIWYPSVRRISVDIPDLQSYYEPDILELQNNATYFDLTYEPATSTLKSDFLPQDVMVGGYQIEDVATFLAAIVFYLFAHDKCELASLPKATMRGGQAVGAIDNFQDVTYLADPANANRRLIFYLEIDGRYLALKVTIDNKAYQSEFQIYHELMQLHRDDVIRIYNKHNRPYSSPDYTLFANLDKDWLPIDKINLPNSVLRLRRLTEPHLYLLLERDPKYQTLEDTSHTYSLDQKRDLLETVLIKLYHLHKEVGFTHWDLHCGNLFVNIRNPLLVKFYDFDRSSTLKHPTTNFYRQYLLPLIVDHYGADSAEADFYRNLTPQQLGQYGLVYDFGRLALTTLSESDLELIRATDVVSPMGHLLHDLANLRHQIAVKNRLRILTDDLIMRQTLQYYFSTQSVRLHNLILLINEPPLRHLRLKKSREDYRTKKQTQPSIFELAAAYVGDDTIGGYREKYLKYKSKYQHLKQLMGR